MKNMLDYCLATLGIFLPLAASVPQQRDIRPEDPAEAAKSLQVRALMEQARSLLEQKRATDAITLFEQAASIQSTMIGFKASANLELARTLVGLGR